MNGFNIGPQDIQQLQQQLQQQQQNLQNLQQMLLLQSTGQLGLPTNLQALLGLQNSGMFSSNMMNQGIQHLASSTMNLAASSNQQQLLRQSPNQLNGQRGSPPSHQVNNQKQLNQDKNQLTSSYAKMNAAKILQDFTPSTINTNGDGNKGKMNSVGSTLATNETKAATTLISSFPLRSRSEPSPEEMTDLEELEQFAKMFKQRRIKLGKFFVYLII